MIVPGRRMIWWSAAVLLPAGLCLAVAPLLSLAVAGVYLLIVVSDAARAVRRLPALSVDVPRLLRLARLRPGILLLRLQNNSARPACVRVGLAFPPTLASSSESVFAEIPASSAVGSEWSLTGRERGSYPVTGCVVEIESPLGLWAARASRVCEAEIRVYPDLQRESKRVASLLLHGSSGAHRLRQLGQGREFEKLREYVPGDSYSDIHWKATARHGRPITKLFQVEKTQQVYVLIDISRLSGRLIEDKTSRNGAGPQAAIEHYLNAALLLAAAAQKEGDLFGAVAFSDMVDRFVRASGGQASFQACRQALYDLQVKSVSPDLEELGAFIGTRLRRRALLVFLTDLVDPVVAEGFVRSMEVIGRRHLVVVTSLRHPWTGRLFSGAEVGSTGDIYRALAGHMEWQKSVEMEKSLDRLGVRYRQIEPGRLGSEVIGQYLGIKRRQLL